MSVEISGAAGYDYQDLICLYLSLLLKNQENIQIKIETPNGEDCEIKYINNDVEYIIDVQVKNRIKLVEISEFSEWLAHFEKLSSTNHLLSKQNRDANRFLLFVTNSRAENELISFVQKENIPLHDFNVNGFNNDLIDNLKEGILSSITGTTNLAVKRRKALENFCSISTKPVFRNILKKIKLWELQDGDLVRERIGIILNKEFLVPKSKIHSLILELLDIIKSYKGKDESIVPNIIAKIENNSERYIFPTEEVFFEHEDFFLLEKELQDYHLLLLSGVSLCGKSFSAKKLASKYQEDGYYCLLTSDIDKALNFALKKNMEDKILILEDPFGAIMPEERSQERIRKIEIICQSRDLNNKIIITSRSDILLNVFNVIDLEKCKINSFRWFDLTNKDTKLIEDLWNEKLESRFDVYQVLDSVINYLKHHSQDNYLQVGELNYLLNNKSMDELVKLDITEIIDIARVNANRISSFIATLTETAKKLFITITLSCNTTKYTQLKHINYILSQSGELYSIRVSPDDDTFTIEDLIGEDQAQNVEWDYQNVFDNKISDDYRGALLLFKKYGYIALSKEGIIFTHPIYQHAGYLILMQEIELQFLFDDNITEMIKRGISTTSKESCIASIKVLEYLYLKTDDKEPFLNLFLLALNSIYPSVIDRSITFLIKNFNSYTKEIQQKIVNKLMLGKDITDKIKWNNDEPYIHYNSTSYEHFLRNFSKPEDMDITSLTIDFLTSKEIWEGLKLEYREEFGTEYLRFLNKAIYLDEVFIKEKAYYFVHQDVNLMNVLKYNEHPSIIFKSFIGAFHSWEKYSRESKEKMIMVLAEYLKSPPVLVRFLRFLENFQDEYITDGIDWSVLNEDQKIDLWKVWYELFYIIFDAFPFDLNQIDEPHLVAVARESLDYIKDSNLIVQFATRWHQWLKSLNSKSYPDDYAMSVAAYLMEGTKNDSEGRAALFEKLLRDNETSLITTHLSHFVTYWYLLNEHEKSQILSLINSSRKDNKWLKAIALTGRHIPKEIQVSLIGEEITTKEPEYIIDKLSKIELLEPCLNVYTGFPQPLWWNGYHSKNGEFWDIIISEVLITKSIECSFRLALKEFIDELYNKTLRFEGGMELYSNLLEDEEISKIVFEELIFVSSTQNQSNKEMWDKFTEKSEFIQNPFYLDLVLQNIEPLQYQQLAYNDLLAYFDSVFIQKYIIPNFKTDETLFILINQYKKYINDDVQDMSDKVLGMIKFFLEFNPPKLSLTNKITKYTLRELGVMDDSIEAIIERNRKSYINRENSTLYEKSHYDLKEWQY
ncbi:hypothetical protein ACSS6N_09460 [Peribacillus frigoritolerans]|uniref:nSTAND3 domain-containing NTPase n=1 Tax=Peribacillus frigoritolerans TaxID=450367 RepID=UPI003F82E1BC